MAGWGSTTKGQHVSQCLVLPEDKGPVLKCQLDNVASALSELEVLELSLTDIPVCQQVGGIVSPLAASLQGI